MKKGFTLIELLVVVLIIGILSSVALPMYRKSVAKARAAEALQMGKAWANAQRVYRLETGKYTESIQNLSITIPPMKYFTIGSHYGSYIKFFPIGSSSWGYDYFQFSLTESGELTGTCIGSACQGIMPCGDFNCPM